MIRTAKIVPHKKRQGFLCDMIGGVIKSRSVVFSEIADKIDKPIKASSIERRIQDFFAKVRFDYTQLAVFLLSFLPQRPLVLSIDRTEWDFGQTQINILCVVASIGKLAVPLYFEMLDNNSGNSNARDRINLFKQLIGIVDKERIQMLVMDREFIGQRWLRWLKDEKIPFCVRVPKHHSILLTNGQRLWAETVARPGRTYYQHEAIVDGVVVNLALCYGKDSELLYLIGTTLPQTLAAWYKRRWSIEVFFQALKGRGFDLERSSLRCLLKYRKLFALVAIAYTLCWATGIEDGKINPVKPKKHGYPPYSVFRRGLNLMRQFYKQKIYEPVRLAVEAAWSNFSLFYKTIG
ncbi:IS4 family transposase [Tunicatimonas pelagia]|uniref:IS4 family transposase n=1 Tax=Tunicatimonas pelagia TaxID=931531 RepID=UPI00266522D4|nr:IS4 family transposase [Tunicatimonas pelagia]WKN42350.1 IS4 family transposase [Tunicatimonas pelagia]